MNGPAVKEWINAREGLRVAYERAREAIEPLIEECLSESKDAPLITLTLLGNPANTPDWPWLETINRELQKALGQRTYAIAIEQRVRTIQQSSQK